MKTGTFKARVINYGITSTKDGNPQATINFRLLIDEEKKETVDMMWSGSLKEGRAQEITIDSLIVCGYKENNLNLFADGKGLDPNKVVQLVVEDDTYNGKTTQKIKWVNEVGSGSNKEFLAKTEAIVKLQGLNLEAAFLAKKGHSAPQQPKFDAADVPF